MPVIDPNSPTVNVPVPVVRPADTGKKRPRPQSPPTGQATPPQQSQPVPPLPPQLKAVIMPWVPTTGKVRKRRYSRTTPYTPELGAWWARVTESGSLYGNLDPAAAGSLADWLEEHDDWRHHLLRTAAQYHTRPDLSYSNSSAVRPDGTDYLFGSQVSPVHHTDFNHDPSDLTGTKGRSIIRFGYGIDGESPRIMVNTYHHRGQHVSVMTPEEYARFHSDAASAGVPFPEAPESHRPATPAVLTGRQHWGNLYALPGKAPPIKADGYSRKAKKPRVRKVKFVVVPEPTCKARVGRPVRYSHEAFMQKMAEQPNELTHRKVYADWIEENDPTSITPKHLDRLRNYDGPMWFGRSASGKVLAIPYLTKEHAVAAGSGSGQRFYHKNRRKSDGSASEVRASGKARVWKRRPDHFELPVKEGLYGNGVLTPGDTQNWLIESPTAEPS